MPLPKFRQLQPCRQPAAGGAPPRIPWAAPALQAACGEPPRGSQPGAETPTQPCGRFLAAARSRIWRGMLHVLLCKTFVQPTCVNGPPHYKCSSRARNVRNNHMRIQTQTCTRTRACTLKQNIIRRCARARSCGQAHTHTHTHTHAHTHVHACMRTRTRAHAHRMRMRIHSAAQMVAG